MLDQQLLIGTVFLAGLASFLSPCIFPIIPIYFGILSKGGKKVLNTFLFILGLSLTFVSLGFSFGFLGNILFSNTTRIIAGIIVIISMVMRDLPIGMRAAIAGLGQLDKSLDEASLSLKGSSWKTLWYIVLPLLKPALLSALVTSFVRAMTTVSAIIFLVTADTRVATAYILNRVEDGEYGVAIAYGSILIVVMMAIILFFDWIVGDTRISRSKAKKMN